MIDTRRPADGAAQQRKGLLAIYAVLLVVLVFAAYGRTLTSYFIADDFGEVAYVARMVGGRWDLFWSNWTGNYMQIPGMAVYRPFLLVSLLTDFLLWKTNAAGYYATNLLFYIGDTLLMFAVAAKLTKDWGIYRSTAAAFLGAALFAVSPLHCETVSWVVGRVDSTCLFMSLASIFAFLQARETSSKRWMAASVACFLGGLLFKEMAIGVPVLASAIAIVFARKFDLKALALEVAPLWLATVFYFVLRLVVLGTLVGGYTGAIGDGQAAQWYMRWLDVHNYERLLLPFAVSLYPKDHGYATALKLLYAAAATLVALRLLRRDLPLRHTLLLAAWMLSAALPIYKLWGIGMDIEGARFCFFLTVPMCLTLPLLLLAPKSDKAQNILSVAIIAAILMVNYKTALHTNANWVHAGKEVHAVFDSAVVLEEENPGKQIVVLGIPKVRAGAHMIYNGATFKTMLEPPFVPDSISDRFSTFDPIFYGPDQYINATRFRALLQQKNAVGPFVWSSEDKHFNQIDWRATDPTWANDFAEVTCNVSSPKGPVKLFVSWKEGQTTAQREFTPVAGKQVVRVPVSHYWRWFTTSAVTNLEAKSSDPQHVTIESTRLVSDSSLRPLISVAKGGEDGSGVYAVEQSAPFAIDATRIAGGTSVQLECSKPNYFFDQIPESAQSTAILKTVKLPGTTFNGTLPKDLLPRHEYCELRVRALDSDGKPLAEYSDPVIVYLR